MEERWCEVRDGTIRSTCVVDPETAHGQEYLELMSVMGALMLPEDDARARYPEAPNLR